MKRTGLWVLALLASYVVLGVDTASADELPRIRLYLPVAVDGDPEDPHGTLPGVSASVAPDRDACESLAPPLTGPADTRGAQPFHALVHSLVRRFLDLAWRVHWIPGR